VAVLNQAIQQAHKKNSKSTSNNANQVLNQIKYANMKQANANGIKMISGQAAAHYHSIGANETTGAKVKANLSRSEQNSVETQK